CEDSSSISTTPSSAPNFLVTESTQLSFQLSQTSYSNSSCSEQVCISDQVPQDGEFPDVAHPIVEEGEWQATHHLAVSKRYHLIGGGYMEYLDDPNYCESAGFSSPCLAGISEVFLYDTASKKSFQMSGIAVAPGQTVAEVVDETFYRWHWIEPNSRFNQTDDLYLWGQINLYYDGPDYSEVSACGIGNMYNLWKFNSQTVEFVPAHYPMCSRFGTANPLHIEFDDGIEPSIVMEPLSYHHNGYWQNPIAILSDGKINMPYRVCESAQPIDDVDASDPTEVHECFVHDGTRHYTVNYLF
ncbi:hypothetical protein ACP45A_15185, partial [Vibrio genomosp. F10]